MKTVTQILNRKHMYQALEVHTVTVLALYSLYFQKVLQNHPEEEYFFEINIHSFRRSVSARHKYRLRNQTEPQ